jgi:hypothetical protein
MKTLANWYALIIGLIALAGSAASMLLDRQQFFVSYLCAYLFWNGISQGGMAILMLHQLTGGGWGYAIRRPLLAITGTLPVIALGFIPIGFGLHDLYLWARPEVLVQDTLLQHKTWYLNEPFFLIRAGVYFAILLALALTLARWCAMDIEPSRRLQRLSAGGLVVYVVTGTFAAFDWIMSLTPHWYSTTFGLLIGVGQMLGAFAFTTVTTALVRGHVAETLSPQHLHDLGNLLLMFILSGAYLAFMQYLIIWFENLPHEISWYISHAQTSWYWLGLFIIVFQLVVPLLVLLSRRAKRDAAILGSLAAMVVLVHWADVFWLVAPTFRPNGFRILWTDLATFIGIGGIWLALFLTQLSAIPTVPSVAREVTQHG